MLTQHFYTPTVKLNYVLLMLLSLGMGGSLAVVLIWASQPQVTEIDLGRRVCLHTRGWGRQQKTWTISLDEINEVCVSFRNRVYLNSTQKESLPYQLTLGQFPLNGFSPMRPRTLHFAHGLANTLGLPVREVPAGAA